VTKACLLDQDVQKLSDKWQTEIVDRGANLSVELRTRIAIARAVYSNLDILLVDDVLANLDKSTTEHIYQKVFKGLLKNKTVILTTS
jgi:ABC-type multidrug transport system fused ATPase/permease subunit